MDRKTARGHPRGRVLIAAVLVLAVVAALGVGAAPAAAAAGCDCHTAEPPTATAAHAPYVVSITDCATCHVDWVAPHPDVGPPIVWMSDKKTPDGGLKVRAWVLIARPVPLGFEALGQPGVVVHLQQRLWGETAYSDVAQTTTNDDGDAVFTIASPAAFATYRAIAQGHVGPVFGGGTRLFEPRRAELLPKAVVTLRLTNLRNGAVRLGVAVRARGTVRPADLGGKVSFVVQKRVNVGWRTRPKLAGHAQVSTTGSYSWRFTPKSRGLWRVQAGGGGTDLTRGDSSPWRQFRVK